MLSLYVLNIEYIRTEYSVQCSRILKLNYNSYSSCFLSSILFTLLRNRSNFVLETLIPSRRGKESIYCILCTTVHRVIGTKQKHLSLLRCYKKERFKPD